MDVFSSRLFMLSSLCIPYFNYNRRGQLEAKLRKALSEIEARERALKAKEESWKSEHAQKLSEIGLQQRRLREEARHQVTSFEYITMVVCCP